MRHTHDKSMYAVRVGRSVTFMARPQPTRQKKYREPVVVEQKDFPTTGAAQVAVACWERMLDSPGVGADLL